MISTIATAVLSCTLVLSACSTTGSDVVARPIDAVDETGRRDARTHVESLLRSRGEAGDGSRPPYTTLRDLLPNTVYEGADGSTYSLSDLVVVGRFVDVDHHECGGTSPTVGGACDQAPPTIATGNDQAPRQPDRGFVVPETDGSAGVASDFADPDAQWWSVRATFQVDRELTGQAVTEQLPVGLVVGPPETFELVSIGLRELGLVVLFLERGSPVFDHDDSLYGIVQDGSFLATVDEADGRIELPAFGGRATPLLEATPLLADLERAAAQDERVVGAG